jgi:hypothetical protein
MEVINIDAKAVEAARVATLAWGKATAKAEGLSSTMGAAIRAAWPVKVNADKPLIRSWIVEAAIFAQGKEWGEVYNAPAPAKEQIAGSAWKRAHNLIDTRVSRAFGAAYPTPVATPVAPTLTPDQIEAKVAQDQAKAAQIEWVEAANEAGAAKAEAAVKNAEVKVIETKAKAAEAKAKIDPAKATEAEALKAQAEAAKAEAAQIKAKAAEIEEAAKVKEETAKILKAQADEREAAIKLAAKVAKVIEEAEALLVKAGALEGAEGLVDFMTATRNAVAVFKAANA